MKHKEKNVLLGILVCLTLLLDNYAEAVGDYLESVGLLKTLGQLEKSL